MRLPTLFTVTLAASSLHAMQVVVVASDMHVVEYIANCDDRARAMGRLSGNVYRATTVESYGRAGQTGMIPYYDLTGRYARSLVDQPTRIDWHVVGGVPPYRLIDDQRDLHGNVCITVVDAEGRVATGCAVVQMRRTQVELECPPGQRDEIGAEPAPSPRKEIIHTQMRPSRHISGGDRPADDLTRTRRGTQAGDGVGTRSATYIQAGGRGSGGGGTGGGTTWGGGVGSGSSVR